MLWQYLLGILIAHYIAEKLYERRLRKFGEYIYETMKDYDPTPRTWSNEILKEMNNENINRMEYKRL